MLSNRDRFLMGQAFDAAKYYDTLEKWLSEVISDAGHLVEDHLDHDERATPHGLSSAEGAVLERLVKCNTRAKNKNAADKNRIFD